MLSPYFWVVVISWVFVFPLLTCPRIGGLKHVSVFTSLLAIMFLVVMLVSLAYFPLASFNEVPWFRFDLTNLIVGFTLIFYPTQMQLGVQHVFNEMKDPTTARSMKAVLYSLLYYYLPTILFGVCGCFLFSEGSELHQKENLFKLRFYSEWLPVQISAWLFLLTSLTLVLLLMMSFKILVF